MKYTVILKNSDFYDVTEVRHLTDEQRLSLCAGLRELGVRFKVEQEDNEEELLFENNRIKVLYKGNT